MFSPPLMFHDSGAGAGETLTSFAQALGLPGHVRQDRGEFIYEPGRGSRGGRYIGATKREAKSALRSVARKRGVLANPGHMANPIPQWSDGISPQLATAIRWAKADVGTSPSRLTVPVVRGYLESGDLGSFSDSDIRTALGALRSPAPRRGRKRRNPSLDERRRGRERAAAGGDPEAQLYLLADAWRQEPRARPFVMASWPRLNKRNTIGEYAPDLLPNQHGATPEAPAGWALVTERVVLSPEEWSSFVSGFLTDRPWLASKGGSFSLDDIEELLGLEPSGEYARLALEVSDTAGRVVYVDPQGHNYARYVGFPIGFDPTPYLSEPFVAHRGPALPPPRAPGMWARDVLDELGLGRELTMAKVARALRATLKRRGVPSRAVSLRKGSSRGIDVALKSNAHAAAVDQILGTDFAQTLSSGRGGMQDGNGSLLALIHPFAREDQSDLMTDYWQPGGIWMTDLSATRFREELRRLFGAQVKAPLRTAPAESIPYQQGFSAGQREVVGDEAEGPWYREQGIAYLREVGAPLDEFDRGHQAAIRTLLSIQPADLFGEGESATQRTLFNPSPSSEMIKQAWRSPHGSRISPAEATSKIMANARARRARGKNPGLLAVVGNPHGSAAARAMGLAPVGPGYQGFDYGSTPHRLSGKQLASAMRKAKVSVKRLALQLDVTQARVRKVRKVGVKDQGRVYDWLEAIRRATQAQNPYHDEMSESQLASLPGGAESLARYEQFHGSAPDGAFVVETPGPDETRVVVGLGYVPESHYFVDSWKGKSNKAGPHWVHEHPEGKEPLEVLDPMTELTHKLPTHKGMRVTDWWRE